jgi:V8-like Glu-specific endopeptidase
MTSRHRRGGRLLLGLAAATLLAPFAPAVAQAAPDRVAVPADLTSTIALSNCSASLVRWPGSQGPDRALMLTNGHCYEGGMPGAGVVLTDRASTRSGTLLRSDGSSAGTVRAERLVYATMTGTDVALYRLNESFDAIRTRTGLSPLTVSASRPAAGTAMFIPSGYWKRVWQCGIDGFVYQLRESSWTFRDSLRYTRPCDTIGGTSGSPVVNTSTGQVIGVNNTINESGGRCTLNNPCEVDQNGNVTVDPGRAYGQQTYWFTTCLSSARTIDLTVPGCMLPGATTEPPPTGDNLLKNPGFESGAVDWTGTSGPITNNSGRPARTGTWKAWLGGNGSTSTETVQQSVAVPAAAAAPKLSYWIRTDTSESGSTVYDRMRVQIVDGATTTTLATYTNVGTFSTYAQKTHDLTAFKGKSVTVKFLMTEDSSLQTSFVVDDTSVTAS